MQRKTVPLSDLGGPAWGAWLAAGLLDAIPGAVVGTDLDGQILYWNDAAERLYGYTRAQMVGANVMALFVEVQQLPDAETIMARVVDGQSWTGEFPVKTADGSMVTVRLTDSPLWHAGQVVGVIGIAEMVPVYDATATAKRLAEARVTRLAHVTAELAACADTNAVTAVVIAHAADAIGANVASLSLLTDEDTLTLVGLRGGHTDPGPWSSYPISADLPASEALRTGKAIVLADRVTIETRYPALAGAVSEDRAMVCLPLAVGGRRVGAISLGFAGPRVPDRREMQFLEAFADTCAQALERIRALTEATQAAAKLALLADVSVALAASLDYRVTLTNVARLTVPTLADWCAVDIVEDGALRTLAVEHADPEKVALALELRRRYPADPEAPTGPANVLRTGRSELYPEITDEMLVAASRDEEQLRLTRELGFASLLVVPLAVRGRTLGTITLVSAESGRRYGPADLAFAENLARRAATAIDNAELFTQTQQAATRLQRAVLPSGLPRLSGWEFACHYSPAGRTEVGGDFYDVVVLPDGRLVGLVGDVMGRGVAAAAAMAQMRAAIRAYIALDPDPVTVLTRLDAMFALFAMSQFVTMVLLLVDPSTDTLTVVSAGHLPLLLIDAEGTVTTVWAPITPPLGVGGERLALTHTFARGSTVLAYTDGLVERRDEDIDVGIARLIQAATALKDGDLTESLQRVVRAQEQTTDDDVTALALRRTL